MNDLRGLCILVTRPGSSGKMLCEEITTLGGGALHLPTIEFAPVENRAPSLDQYQWLIFVSQQAVNFTFENGLCKGGPMCSSSGFNRRVAAIGEGTAQVLQAVGFKDIVYPRKNWTSEGLLALPDFQHVTGQKILLIRGKGGREWLADTLQARGAQVDHWVVYRRLIPQYADVNAYCDLLQQKKIDILVCASGESLHNLITIIGTKDSQALLTVPLIVVSQRLETLAKALNFQQVFVAANAGHAAVIEAACFIKEKFKTQS